MAKITLRRKIVAHIGVFVTHRLKLSISLVKTHKLYQDIPSYSISKQYRHQTQTTNPDYIYGEFNLESFIYLCKLASLSKNKAMVDLGCGDGKLLAICAHYFENVKITGVEIVEPLLIEANKVALKLNETIAKRQNTLTIVNEDARTHPLHPYDLIYVNFAAVSEATWKDIYENLLTTKPGTKIISVARTLDKDFELIYKGQHKASWGMVWIYIYHRSDCLDTGF